MKLTTVLIIAAFLQVSARGFSQNLSFSGKNVPLQKVFSAIEKQSGYVFFYDYAIFEHAHPITLNLKDVSLQVLMDAILKDQGMSYKIAEKTIFLIRNPAAAVPAPVASPTPPTTDIRGRVTNEKGEPLAGASIQVKGSRRGVVTDANGGFEIRAADNNLTLIISYAGYSPREIKASGKDFFEISLLASNSELDAPVVIAYGTTTKRLNTGNVATVTSKEIEQQPVSNPLAALEGRVPGLIVTQSNGLPGSVFKVQLRGQSSIGSSPGTLPPNDPLFIIDGVPFATNNTSLSQISSALFVSGTGGVSPFNSINPGDIESIEVLKDADATSIYGSRGANGVVLITTKKGKSGKTNLNVNVYTGSSNITRVPKMLNTQQYLQMRHEAFTNDGVIPTITNAPDLLVFDTTRYTDFRKILTGGSAGTTDAQASISGGNLNTQFLFGGSYHHETTVFPGNLADNRGTFHVNINHNSIDHRFNANFSASYGSDKNNLIATDLTTLLNLAPDVPSLFDSVGNLVWRKAGQRFNNPFGYLKRAYSAQTDNLLSNFQLNYSILKGLILRASLGYNTVNDNELSQIPIASQDPGSNPTGSSQFGTGIAKTWIIEPQVEYTRNIARGKLNVLLGSTWQDQTNSGTSISGSGYTSDNLLQSINAAPTITNSQNSFSKYRYEAFFGKIGYNWQDKYILNLSARRDGSSRFGPGKQFGNFGAIGAAWIFSNEKIVQRNLAFLSFGKLRGSYGTSGNDQIGNYNYLSTWSSTQFPYQGVAGLSPTQLSNPGFSWEVNHKLEVAAELGFLKDRILFTAAYFRNRSSNELLSYNLPSQVGFSYISVANFPATIQNSGLELTITSKNVVANSFSWNTTLLFNLPRNELISFPGLATSPYSSTIQIGQPLSIIHAYHFLGVDPNTGISTYQTKNSNGFPSYPVDQHFGKNRDPKYYGGVQNSFKYKGWQLDIFLEGRKQYGYSYLKSIYGTVFPGRYLVGIGNAPLELLSRWQKSGDHSAFQKLTQATNTPAYPGISYFPASDGILTDASFIRLKTLSLSYTITQFFLEKWHISNARIYFQGQNLLTATPYKGSDPESQNMYSLPPLRTFTGGIQLTF